MKILLSIIYGEQLSFSCERHKILNVDFDSSVNIVRKIVSVNTFGGKPNRISNTQ